MSKTTILLVCAFAGAILLGTTTMTPADPGNGIPARLSALEAAFATHDHDGDYVVAAHEKIALVKGSVRPNGVIRSGAGFTVEHEGDGTYYVEFDAGTFSSSPTVILQPWVPAEGQPKNHKLGAFSPDGFRVIMTSGEDTSFKFIAVSNH